MPDMLQIEPVTSEDRVALVAEIAREIWYEYYVPLIGRPQVEYMVDKFQTSAAIVEQIGSGYEYFLVHYGSQRTGYLAIRAEPQEQRMFISKFYLHGSTRGRGTGRRCMEFIEQLATQRGLLLLWLTVNKANPSVKVYQRLGFRIAADIEIDIGGGFVMDDFRMEKLLLPAYPIPGVDLGQ
jgi:diamine N-acetyltransferase